MKGQDFSRADFMCLFFSLEASVQLAFLTLIVGKNSNMERPLLLYLSLIQSQTLLFIQPTKFYPGRQRTLASIRDPKIHIGRILQVRKWLFDNYLLHDRLEHNQSIKQIQRLGVYPALLKNTQRLKKWGKPLYCFFLFFFPQNNPYFAQNLYVFKRNESAVRTLHTPVISEKR